MGHSNDTVLVKKISKGNGEAFKIIYDRYHESLFFFARKYVKEQQLAEDAVQDIFLKLWKKRDTLDPSRSVKAFLFTMLKNHLLNLIRDQKERILSAYTFDEEKLPHRRRLPDRNRTDDEVIYNEYQNIFNRGLDELSDGRREVFEMRVFKDLSNAQVAKQLHVSIHTVKSQFYHGSKFIRSYLQRHCDITVITLINLTASIPYI